VVQDPEKANQRPVFLTTYVPPEWAVHVIFARYGNDCVLNGVSYAHVFESHEEFGRGEGVVFGPEVHVRDQIVRKVARNRKFFVGHLEPSVESLHNLLVKLHTHGCLQICQNVHLCKEGQCHESAMHLAKNAGEALLNKAVHQNNEHAIGHVNIVADFLQQRYCKGNNALDTEMLHLVHIDILCDDATKQRGDESMFVLDARWLYAHYEQRDLLLCRGLGRPGDGMYGHIGRDAVICRRQSRVFVLQALQHFAQRHPALSRPNLACHQRPHRRLG